MTQTEQKLVSDEELNKMFNDSFLPMLQEIAKRVKDSEKYENIEFFNAQMVLQFSDLSEPLTYQNISDKLNLRLMPVTTEDLKNQEATSNGLPTE